jgi:hypothetical protein
MSSGGGIARFASRKNDSTNTGPSATAVEHENDIATATPATNAFSFGATNDTNDALSTASDDEFGLLSGSNSFGCGDDFGSQGDGGFGEENYNVGQAVSADKICRNDTKEDSIHNPFLCSLWYRINIIIRRQLQTNKIRQKQINIRRQE